MTLGTFLHYDINFYAMALVASVLGIMHWRRSGSGHAVRLFRGLLTVTLVMLVLEVVSWAFDGRPGDGYRLLNYASNLVYLWLNPLIPCLWASYIDYAIFGSVRRLRRRLYYSHPMVVSTLLVAVQPFWPVLFTVSEANQYARGPAIWVNVASTFAMLVLIIAVAVRNRSRLRDGVVPAIILFISGPAIAVVVQMMVYGALLIWPMMALALVVSYVVLETVTASRDHLTGLSSRLRVEEYVRNLVDSRTGFGLIVIDLDDFKLINDQYGHQSGDEALILFADVLRDVFASQRIVARFGGDEFAVVTASTTEAQLETYRRSMLRRVDALNADANRPYRIRMSFGATVADPSGGDTLETAFSRADACMYADKAHNKNLQRRASDRPGPFVAADPV